MIKSFLNFDTFIFPKIATVIYWIGLVLIVLGTLASAFGALFRSDVMGNQMGGLGFLFVLVGGVIAIIAWRVVVEFWLVIFSIRDHLRDIRDQGRGLS
ncbi:DUF4282 domain-containing protein [Pelagibacterium halotolerans]|uniref:DUF4282 domain-containing protein n=1 Tax=Pelagibacterium halotolerans TaxID=531813 RepID=UPI00385102E7